MTDRCTALKKDNTRCSKDAEPGSALCWSHDPANEEDLRSLARDVNEREVSPPVGTSPNQSYNTLPSRA